MIRIKEEEVYKDVVKNDNKKLKQKKDIKKENYIICPKCNSKDLCDFPGMRKCVECGHEIYQK